MADQRLYGGAVRVIAGFGSRFGRPGAPMGDRRWTRRIRWRGDRVRTGE